MKTNFNFSKFKNKLRSNTKTNFNLKLSKVDEKIQPILK